MKTGEHTDPAVLHALESLQRSREPEKGSKPAKRLHKKTPQKEVEVVLPEQGTLSEEGTQPEGNTLPEEGTMPEKGMQPQHHKALTILSQTPPSSSQSSVAASVVSLSSTSTIAANDLKRACKRPAAASHGSPAKKPAMATKKPAGKAISGLRQHSWVTSCSFEWIKAIAATEKAYIVARAELTSKPYCLVNINLEKGSQQTSVLEACMAEAAKPGLDKAHMVDFKNNLMKRL
eukprot:Skav204921  [mRNA]  locus=scaffold526:15429:16127:- [translate_table: standard]